MNTQKQQINTSLKSSFTPASPGLLQRKCACGNHITGGGECAECSKKKRLGLQTKLRVNEPGDKYEREADRVANQVMAMPAQQMASSAPPRIQRFSGEAAGRNETAPDSVHQTLASPGRPLDSALRQDMEQRFGYDFSRVRVHPGAAAEQSARDVNAHAYTVGQDIVFGVGRFAPATHEGRKLIAHELTHIVQQQSSSINRIQRQPQGAQAAPGSRRVPPGPGEYTPKEYEAWLKAHPRREYRLGGSWEPDAMYARYTPRWFWDRGYVYAGRGGNIPYYWFEVWISNEGKGKEFRVWRTPDAGGKAVPSPIPPSQAPKKEPFSGPVIEGTEDWPTQLDPNADREDLFGPIIAAHEVDAAFGEGYMVLYEDGTVELFLEGTTQSYVFRPIPGGGYVVYDPDGQRLDMIWIIPEEDIPDPDTDAVE